MGEIKLQEAEKVVEGHLLGDATKGCRGALRANDVERLGEFTSSAHPCICIYGQIT